MSFQAPTEREELTSRQLPEMTLSNGDAPGSRTAAPPAPSSTSSKQERATTRFAITGNAIVTGGGGTLAYHASQALLDHGLQGLILWDIDFSDATSDIKALKTRYPDAFIETATVDVTDAAAVERAMGLSLSLLARSSPAGARVDHLCNFAGVVGCFPALEYGIEQFRRVLKVNAEGAWIVAQAAGKQMAAQQPSGGSIVLIASISGRIVNFPQPQVAYNSSKAFVQHMGRSLAAELAIHGIRTNTISPGYMDTILNEGPGLERARAIWNSRNPIGRMGQPWELGGAVVLLCSQAGSFMNGTDIVIDGGASVF